VTSLLIEHFGTPASVHDARAQEMARARAAADLAGRTVWSATGLPRGQRAAGRLRAALGEAVQRLEVTAEEPVRRLTQRLEDMLKRSSRRQQRPDGADHDVCARGLADAEAAMGAGVRPDDVVVLHDPLSALLAQAVRDRGAHAVWYVDVRDGAPGEAWTFLRSYTHGVDAYVMAWSRPSPRGRRREEHIAALVPCADLVADKEIDRERDGLGWSTVLADVVGTDREERVGGRRHPRPAVAPR
jgi:trehalose synthase